MRELWIVDPVDGTKEFIKRNGEFTVNIALVRDGQPVMGVVPRRCWAMFLSGSLVQGLAFECADDVGD